MDFEEILDKVYGYDCEVTMFDNLFIFINYRTGEKHIFHNATADELNTFINKKDIILLGFNNRGYDKYILQGVLGGCDTTEIKNINDFIIGGHNGYELDLPYVKLPPQLDLFPEIVPRKSLKEIEGILCMDITESTVDFNIDHKWTKQEAEEMIYYCTKDVEALFPIFEKLIKKYKAKYIISQLGGIDPVFALTQTDANLTAMLLGAEKKEHDDTYNYKYPSVIDKNKIPKEFIDRIDDCVIHQHDENYINSLKPVEINFEGGATGYVNYGGIHIAKPYTFCYNENEVNDIECV